MGISISVVRLERSADLVADEMSRVGAVLPDAHNDGLFGDEFIASFGADLALALHD